MEDEISRKILEKVESLDKRVGKVEGDIVEIRTDVAAMR